MPLSKKGKEQTSKDIVPVISIQCDWDESLRKSEGEAWIACKFRDEPSLNGKLQSLKNLVSGSISVTSTDGFRVDLINDVALKVVHEPSGHQCIFISPIKSFENIHKKSIVSVSSSHVGTCVSACADNKLIVWDSKSGNIKRILDGHFGEIYKCRFFPSGIVVLSGGADMQLKIWCAETGLCPVSLKGHTAAVTDVCIVDRGKNIISVSKDGKAKLWSCGEAKCLADLVKIHIKINCCILDEADNKINLESDNVEIGEYEIGTNNKILIIGCENGSVQLIAVKTRKKISSYTCDSAVNCLSVLPNSLFSAGSQNGKIYLFHQSEDLNPLRIWLESNSPVLSMLTFGKNGFFAGRSDGTCTYYRVNYSGKDNQRIQVTGSDFDPIYDMACDSSYLFTACRDTNVRKYEVSNIIIKTFGTL